MGKLPILKFILCIITVSKQANEKWQLRTPRMKLDNLFFIMMTDRDGEKDIQLLDQLLKKIKRFYSQALSSFKSVYYIKGFEKQNQVGWNFLAGLEKNITI